FGVLSEAGKKDPDRQPGAAELAEQAAADLEAGAWKVIIEARDAGRGIGIFDGDGRLRAAFWEELLRGLPAPDDVIWEAPEPSQQRERSEEHTSELQSRENLVCRLLLEKKKCLTR